MCRDTKLNDATVPIYVPDEIADHGPVPQEELTSTLAYQRRKRRLPTLLAAIMGSAAAGSSAALPLKVAASGVILLLASAFLAPSVDNQKSVRLAIVGNSLMYFNDLPRLLEAMAQGRLEQDSCLHGNADFSSHLWYGNGMYHKWQTGPARISEADGQIFDFGACTVQELLFGEDERITEQWVLDASNSTYTPQVAWEYELEDDGSNPCLMDESYKEYREARFLANGQPHWDFVLMNDNTRSPCCTEQRGASMDLLENVYLPWLVEIQATPIFMVTYSYWASTRDMSGLIDIPTFASLTYNGYQDYYRLAEEYLPSSLKPRIAPVGLAFLLVWEENPSMWEHLIHYDEIHLSPSGTFLEACVVYHTIFGILPDPNIYQGNGGTDQLWQYARRMDPVEDVYKAYPTRQVADYLYHIASRICVHKEVPKSLQYYPANTSIYFTPDDSMYANNPVRGRAVR